MQTFEDALMGKQRDSPLVQHEMYSHEGIEMMRYNTPTPQHYISQIYSTAPV